MTTTDFCIPAFLRTAARLGVGEDLGKVLVLARDLDCLTKVLYLAEENGVIQCAPKWVFMRPEWLIECTPELRNERARTSYAHTFKTTVLKAYRVVENLGVMPETQRSIALIEAADLKIPILEWPKPLIPYVVKFDGDSSLPN